MIVTEIPLAELLQDRTASVDDIAICMRALQCGVTHHRDGFPVEQRIEENYQIIGRIEDELERRGVLVERITKPEEAAS